MNWATVQVLDRLVSPLLKNPTNLIASQGSFLSRAQLALRALRSYSPLCRTSMKLVYWWIPTFVTLHGSKSLQHVSYD
jgi:hypothetical protein